MDQRLGHRHRRRIVGALALSLAVATAACSPAVTQTLGPGQTAGPGKSADASSSQQPAEPTAPPVEASSDARIRTAERAGSIDHATALAYRLFAALDYASLPDAYRSSNPLEGDATAILGELQGHLGELSPDLRTKVASFYLRPSDPASFWATRSPATAAVDAVRLAAFTAAIDFDYVDAAATNVRVFYAAPLGSSEAELARHLAAEIDASDMWAKERTAMLGHEPCTDAGRSPNGGDGRLDVYIVYPGTGLDWGGRTDSLIVKGNEVNGVTIPDGEGAAGCPVATHVIVNGTLDFEHLKSTTAHELFHAFQYSFRNAVLPGRDWWMESTATWAKDLVYPTQNFEQAYLAGYWSQAPGAEGPIDSTEDNAAYGAYLMPFYLVQKSGDPSGVAIGQSWIASQSQTPLAYLGGLSGWPDKFKEFALWNWNQDGAALYRDAGTKIPTSMLSQKTTCIDSHFVKGPGSADCLLKLGEITADAGLDGTTVRYVEGIPDAPLVEKLTFDLSDLVGKKGLGIQAILTIGDSNEVKVEDWTDLPERSFCALSENLTKVVLVLSDSTVEPGTESKPNHVTANIKVKGEAAGCSGWKGTMTGTYDWHDSDGHGLGTSTFTGMWQQAPDDLLVASCRGVPPSPGDCLVYIPSGTIAWRWDVDDPYCSEHRTGTWPAGAENDPRNAPGGLGVPLATQSLILVDDGAGHFGYWGAGTYYVGERMHCSDPVHAGSHPPGYFSLARGTTGNGAADGTGDSCDHTLWQIDAKADAIKGSCDQWNNTQSSMHWEWDLQRVGNATGG